MFDKKPQPSYLASGKQTKEKPETENIHNRISKIPSNKVTLPAESIEEWDCPKPGAKKAASRAVKETIKKNVKRFKSYYKNKEQADSVLTEIPLTLKENR